jgi:hypothetical protein
MLAGIAALWGDARVFPGSLLYRLRFPVLETVVGKNA